MCAAAGLTPAADPSNADERFERVRVRAALAQSDWLDAAAIARSAAYLAAADAALDWATKAEWARIVHERHGAISFRPRDLPAEIVRRLVARAVRRLATEGEGELRGADLDRLLASLAAGDTATLRGVLCRGGPDWRFTAAPARR
jgi:tRNA(Ile)-lysidine synthase